MLAHRRLAALGAPARDSVYRAIWAEAAEQVGARVEALDDERLKVVRDQACVQVHHQDAGLDSQAALALAFDKTRVYALLASARISRPEHLEFDFRAPEPALDFLAEHGACVLKPAAGSGGGDGVTGGIGTPRELRRAMLRAGARSDELLIERQSEGDIYRLLLLDGELLDVVRSVRPRLIGDGVSTIEELMMRENQRRLAAGGREGLSMLGLSLDMVLTLERAGLELSSVLPADEVVTVEHVSNHNSIEDRTTFRGVVSPELLQSARRAAELVGLRLAGIDVITTDPTRPLADTGGVIIDVNGLPGLHHHYLVADRASATRVAVPVLERALTEKASMQSALRGASET